VVLPEEGAFVAADGWQIAGVWAAWATFAVYAALGGFAWIQVLQAKKLREGQARPFVVVDFEMGHPPVMYLVVANLGRTMARNVRFEIDPPFKSGVDKSSPVPLANLKLFAEGIPSLAPGKRITFLFDLLHTRPKELPSSYQVRIHYEWDGGKPITDILRLDLDLYRSLIPAQRETVHNVSRTLKKIERQLDKWSAFGGGLLVLSPEDKRRRDEEILADMEQRRPEPPSSRRRPMTNRRERQNQAVEATARAWGTGRRGSGVVGPGSCVPGRPGLWCRPSPRAERAASAARSWAAAAATPPAPRTSPPRPRTVPVCVIPEGAGTVNGSCGEDVWVLRRFFVVGGRPSAR
jgi:hypothetical protein